MITMAGEQVDTLMALTMTVLTALRWTLDSDDRTRRAAELLRAWRRHG